jgi:NADH:ubiquinone oxidoreductase subunit 2 (subunit N)
MTLVSTIAHYLPALLAQAQAFQSPPLADYIRVLPELILTIFGMVIMLVDPLLDPESSHQSLGTIALVGALAALASTYWMAQYPGTRSRT